MLEMHGDLLNILLKVYLQRYPTYVYVRTYVVQYIYNHDIDYGRDRSEILHLFKISHFRK